MLSSRLLPRGLHPAESAPLTCAGNAGQVRALVRSRTLMIAVVGSALGNSNLAILDLVDQAILLVDVPAPISG